MLQTTETEILAPFEIWEVPLENGNVIKFHSPLVLQPEILDRNTPEECLCVEYPALELFAVGVDIEELQSCVKSDLRMTWQDSKKLFEAIAEEYDG